MKFPVLTRTHGEYPQHVVWTSLREDRALTNHSQTLDRLAERGGLSPEEIVCNMLDISYSDFRKLDMTEEAIINKLKLIEAN